MDQLSSSNLTSQKWHIHRIERLFHSPKFDGWETYFLLLHVITAAPTFQREGQDYR